MARDFESCIRLLRKNGEVNISIVYTKQTIPNPNLQLYGTKPVKLEYCLPKTEPPKYTVFTTVQLDMQLQQYHEAHPPPPPEGLSFF
jgi:hypothetical protein